MSNITPIARKNSDKNGDRDALREAVAARAAAHAKAEQHQQAIHRAQSMFARRPGEGERGG